MTRISREKLREEILADPYFGDAVQFVLNKMGDLHGKVILDVGCGMGKMSVFFALQGATVIGLDKACTRLNEAAELAGAAGVQSGCFFIHGSSEESPIEPTSVDVVFSKSTIQYMERKKALDECVRVLKPGGSIAMLENLPNNPFVNLYRICRKMAARTRQKREYVDSIRGYITPVDIDRLRPLFRFTEQRQYHLGRMISMRLLKKWPFSFLARQLDNIFLKIDTFLLASIPSLRKFAWYVAVYYENHSHTIDAAYNGNATIARCLAEARATMNPLYLFRAVYLLVLQRRFIEATYGAYCFIRFSPSVVKSSWNSRAALDEYMKQLLFSVKDELSLEEICHVFGQDYAVRRLPRDFSRVRIEGAIFYEDLLILGEYGEPGKRIAIVSRQTCTVNYYYETNRSVKHIHSICSVSKEGLMLVATGDTAKYLDLWVIRGGNISFIKHIRKALAGHMAMLGMGNECLLGTDFSARPNYLEFLNHKKKIFFPKKSYRMYVIRLLPYKNRHILCLSRELECLGGRYALSVFDVEQREFIFCDYVQYDKPETVDKVLHRAAITRRSIAAGADR